MASILHGRLILSRIPKELIQTAQDGSKYVWIDVAERKVQGKYGDTHSITIYDKSNKQKHYIADLKPQEFGTTQQSAPQQAPSNSYRQAAPTHPSVVEAQQAAAAAQEEAANYEMKEDDLPF